MEDAEMSISEAAAKSLGYSSVEEWARVPYWYAATFHIRGTVHVGPKYYAAGGGTACVTTAREIWFWSRR